jgi:hypothetical protein
MKKLFFLVWVLLVFNGCDLDYSGTKFYTYFIENHLTTEIVKIVPLDSIDWIIRDDTLLILPGDKIIVSSNSFWDENRKVVDIYEPDEVILRFDLLVNGIKQEKNFTRRSAWTFSRTSVDETGIYRLVINENTITGN